MMGRTEDCLYLNIFTKNLVKRNNYEQVLKHEIDKIYEEKRCNLFEGNGIDICWQPTTSCQSSAATCHCLLTRS